MFTLQLKFGKKKQYFRYSAQINPTIDKPHTFFNRMGTRGMTYNNRDT